MKPSALTLALLLPLTSPAQKLITPADCTSEKLGTSIPVAAIGLPVSAVTLNAPQWREAAGTNPAYCYLDGSMAPIDKAANARPIRFAVALPASWTQRAAQLGGSGNNGVIPQFAGNLPRTTASVLSRGLATYGSDSGHQSPFGRGGPAAASQQSGPPPDNSWATNEEAIANLGYRQLKKTHDAAMVVIERAYGARPRFNYFFGNSQGGREALTVAQRFPADYDGVSAEVPIVSFSSLMLAPELIRIQEKPTANWVTPAKVNAIRAEFMRQCDSLDGLADGIINNYLACRAIFAVNQSDAKQAKTNRDPWAAKRCPNNVDPNPQDTTPAACLTSGQISTLQLVYSPYNFATPLANGVKFFGMWLPNTDPSGSGLILPLRYKGQEGAAPDAPFHSHLGVLGVTGYLMRDLAANPLDYVEGGPLNQRRLELSQILDATSPDLSAYQKRGGKLLVVIGTDDTLASPGAQLAYYQSVIDQMGQAAVDSFARLWVLPQTNHGLMGRTWTPDGQPRQIIPNGYDRFALLTDWVENNKAPAKSITVTAPDRSLPMCSYPAYPKYAKGPVTDAASYTCAAK